MKNIIIGLLVVAIAEHHWIDMPFLVHVLADLLVFAISVMLAEDFSYNASKLIRRMGKWLKSKKSWR